MPLAEPEIVTRLEKLPDWRREGKEIAKRFEFSSYAYAIMFTNAVAYLAERADHHPDMTVGYGYVEVRLSTHDAGGLTERDFRLAQEIEALSPHEFK